LAGFWRVDTSQTHCCFIYSGRAAHTNGVATAERNNCSNA